MNSPTWAVAELNTLLGAEQGVRNWAEQLALPLAWLVCKVDVASLIFRASGQKGDAGAVLGSSSQR